MFVIPDKFEVQGGACGKDEVGHRDRAMLGEDLDGGAVDDEVEIERAAPGDRRLGAGGEARRVEAAGVGAIDVQASARAVEADLGPVLMVLAGVEAQPEVLPTNGFELAAER